TDNLICGSGVAAAIDLKLGGTDIATSTITSACACGSTFDTSDTIGLNKVCIETKPGSDTWFITCASDSYSTYTDADTFTCTRPSASGTDCLGGCEYGQECKYSSDATAECTDVIPDDSLNECIFNLFSDETHCTSDGLFSVASLKTLDTSEDSSYVLSCSSKPPSVTDITGLEHAGFITKIDLSDNDLSDVSLMF
ncbi:hypothetical protein ADUPG1_005531, partial [Aduncisulcus paluster]